MKAYSLDLLQRVLEASASGDRTIAEVAGLFGVTTTFVNTMLRPRRAGEDLAPRQHDGAYPARLPPRGEKLRRRCDGASATWARAGDELNRDLVQAIGLMIKGDIRSWFKHCGYSLARQQEPLYTTKSTPCRRA